MTRSEYRKFMLRATLVAGVIIAIAISSVHGAPRPPQPSEENNSIAGPSPGVKPGGLKSILKSSPSSSRPPASGGGKKKAKRSMIISREGDGLKRYSFRGGSERGGVDIEFNGKVEGPKDAGPIVVYSFGGGGVEGGFDVLFSRTFGAHNKQQATNTPRQTTDNNKAKKSSGNRSTNHEERNEATLRTKSKSGRHVSFDIRVSNPLPGRKGKVSERREGSQRTIKLVKSLTSDAGTGSPTAGIRRAEASFSVNHDTESTDSVDDELEDPNEG